MSVKNCVCDTPDYRESLFVLKSGNMPLLNVPLEAKRHYWGIVSFPEQWQICRLTLHATISGRPLYLRSTPPRCRHRGTDKLPTDTLKSAKLSTLPSFIRSCNSLRIDVNALASPVLSSAFTSGKKITGMNTGSERWILTRARI